MTRSRIRGLENTLLGRLGDRLSIHGFPRRPKGQTFEKATELGRTAIHVSFIEHEEDFDITADVAVRFDAVEELVHRSNDLLSEKEKSRTFTLGAELGTIENNEPIRWTISTDTDVPAVLEALLNKIESVGLPYLEQYAHPDAAFAALSRDDRAAWMHAPIHAERAKRACALLVMMGRHEEVTALGDRKRLFLEASNDPGEPTFRRFLSRLTDTLSGGR